MQVGKWQVSKCASWQAGKLKEGDMAYLGAFLILIVFAGCQVWLMRGTEPPS